MGYSLTSTTHLKIILNIHLSVKKDAWTQIDKHKLKGNQIAGNKWKVYQWTAVKADESNYGLKKISVKLKISA